MDSSSSWRKIAVIFFVLLIHKKAYAADLTFEKAGTKRHDGVTSISVRGHLVGNLEYIYVPNFSTAKNNEATLLRNELSICLLLKDAANGQQLSKCAKTRLFSEMKTSGVKMTTLKKTLSLPLLNKNINTNFVFKLESSTSAPEYFNWTELPTPGRPNTLSYSLTSSNDTLLLLKATFSLSCLNNYYGPDCKSTCTPPSLRHRCDDSTGDLKCNPGWYGANCDINVFIPRNVASQFIKTREKRANTGFEEWQKGNIEQECIEEVCSREEAREAFENDALTERFWRTYSDPNQCKPNPCIPGNTNLCEDLIGRYRCQCKTGFVGTNCERDVRPCHSQPCQHGGTCSNQSPTVFSCTCPEGYRGQDCSINIDDCVNSNCGLHGSCVDHVNSFSCRCDRGFTGNQCDQNIDDCASKPCQNNGKCTDHVAFYTCQCPTGFEGKDCEREVDPCEDGPCMNGGTCSVTPDYNYTCACPSEYRGQVCEHAMDSSCFSSPCANGGRCFPVGDADTNENFTCSCPLGYSGATCEVAFDACEVNGNPCPINSTCLPLNQEYICVCPAGYSGDKCQHQGEMDEKMQVLRCQEDPCLNDAQCFLFQNTTSCVCRPGYEGDHCETEVDHCASQPCTNNGECILVPTGFHCTCAQGYQGHLCEEDVDECAGEVRICESGGTCANTIGSYHCTCDNFHTGRHCEHEFDPCFSEPCQNNGNCRLDAQGYFCDCLEGYGGWNCQRIIDPCTDVTNPCRNRANCTKNPQLEYEAICSCTTGFYGRYCDKPRDYCAVPSNTTAVVNGELVHQLEARTDCGRNGNCVSKENGFACDCNLGYEGDRCETAYKFPIVNCSSDYCQCPTSMYNDVLLRSRNQTVLGCHHNRYAEGLCRRATCLSTSCNRVFECGWQSDCSFSDVKNGPSLSFNESSFVCPLMEVVVEEDKLEDDVTVERFCHNLRNLKSLEKLGDDVLMHCFLLQTDDVNSTIAVSIDSVISKKKAALDAIVMFERLQKELDNKAKGKVTHLTANLDAILSIAFASSSDPRSPVPSETPPHSERKEAMLTYHYVIIAVVIVLIVISIVVIACCLRRRKQGKANLFVSFVANPSPPRFQQNAVTVNSEEATSSSSSSAPDRNAEKYLFDDGFVNPMFGARDPANEALASRKSVRSNTYVSVPYTTMDAVSSGHSEVSTGSDIPTTVEQTTVDYGLNKSSKVTGRHYEIMSGIPTANGRSFASTSTSEGREVYDFALDTQIAPQSRPGTGKKTDKKATPKEKTPAIVNEYEEITIQDQAAAGSNQYEIVVPVSAPVYGNVNGSPTFSLKNRSSTEDSTYNFATEMPSVGVPSCLPPSRGNSTVVSSDADEAVYSLPSRLNTTGGAVETESEKQEQEENGQNLFSFSDKKSELPEIYAVPRMASPTI